MGLNPFLSSGIPPFALFSTSCIRTASSLHRLPLCTTARGTPQQPLAENCLIVPDATLCVRLWIVAQRTASAPVRLDDLARALLKRCTVSPTVSLYVILLDARARHSLDEFLPFLLLSFRAQLDRLEDKGVFAHHWQLVDGHYRLRSLLVLQCRLSRGAESPDCVLARQMGKRRIYFRSFLESD
jgi:hypothetical protein